MDPAYDLEDISPSGSSHGSLSKEIEAKGFTGIKVTTFVTQESTSSPVNDDTGSTKDLVPKRQQSF